MNRWKERLLAAALAASILFTSGSPWAAMTVEAVMTDRSSVTASAAVPGESTAQSGHSEIGTENGQERENARQEETADAAKETAGAAKETGGSEDAAGEEAREETGGSPEETGEAETGNTAEETGEEAGEAETGNTAEETGEEAGEAETGNTAEETGEEAGDAGAGSTAEEDGEEAGQPGTGSTAAQGQEEAGPDETGSTGLTGALPTGTAAVTEPAAMPEFNAEKKAGRYTVKIHAGEGILPEGTAVIVKELSSGEAEPFAEKAEQMADRGIAIAVIDITFTDKTGREIQPSGTVTVTFQDAAEEDSAMSVYHAPDADVTKMEELSAEEKGGDILVKSDRFSPFVLLAASAEPDWTRGGAGLKTEVSDQIQFTHDSVKWYVYNSRDLGDFNTCSYSIKLNGQTVGRCVCLDPRRDGNGVTRSETTYEITAPMLVKALYYGFDGPGRSTIEGITGTSDIGTNNIVTHVSVAEIYARLGYTSKSKVGDGFYGANARLKEFVLRYVGAIEELPVPDNYYMYVSANSDGTKQDFGFGSGGLVPHTATFMIEKDVEETDGAMKAKIRSNSNYGLEGAVYGIYKTKDTAENLRKKTPLIKLTIDKNGSSESCEVNPGTYYAVELKAPGKGGYIISNTVYPVTLKSGEKKTLEVTEGYKYVFLRIIKEPKSVPSGTQAPSLEGAVFEIYSNAKRDKAHYIGTLTTDADGKTQQLKTDTKGGRLLIQTYYVREVKAPSGYAKAGDFSIDTSAAAEADARYTLIDRIVRESVVNAGIAIRKESEDPEITEDNSCYSLAGAEFGVYSDEACTKLVEKIVTDEEGAAATSVKLTVSDYWIRELKAPEGFYENTAIVKVAAGTLAQEPSVEIAVKEVPKTDPAQLTIVKRSSGGGKSPSLAGTEFTFSYYKGLYKSETELPARPERSWTIRTHEKDGRYVARIEDCRENGTFVSGDEFYLDKSGNPTFPLGTVTIRETKAADGYENDPDFGGGAKMLIANVIPDSRGRAVFTVVQGAAPVENTLTVEDTYKEPSIRTSAVDAASRSHTAYAEQGKIRIIDTVTYENLNRNTDYTICGTLMDQASEEPFKDRDGKEITSSKRFRTGDETDGSVEVVFEFECSERDLKGHTLVVKEKLVPDDTNEDAENIPGAEHWDPHDRDQTIYFPEIGTSLREKESGSQIVPADADVELVDTVSYENLMPGDKYTVIGTLMDQATGAALQVEGKEVTSTASFTANEPDGTVNVTFRFTTKGLQGKSLTAFEELVFQGRTVAKHEDLKDAAQTVVIPGIETNAYDEETGKKNTLAAGNRIIVDEISYYGLLPGKTYELTGELKIRPSDSKVTFDEADPVPAVIAAAKGEGSVTFDAEKVTFIPSGNDGEAVNGTLFVSYRTDTSELAGKKIVVGETLWYNGAKIAVHRDIRDEKQTDRIPDGKTTAIDTETGIKNTLAADNRIFRDTFRYENLNPGETYRFTGKVLAAVRDRRDLLEEIPSVMTDETGTPVENGFKEFVPEKENGELDLYFAIDASELADREITVFEKVTLNGKPVIIHEVLDGTQTVYVPDLKTTAVDSETGDRVSMPDEEATVIDTMVYRNLIPGKEYTVKGRVMKKSAAEEVASVLTEGAFAEGSTGSVLVADGAATFIPDEADGALELTFRFRASELAGEDVVLYERVYHNGSEVIVHENIDDEAQTVHFPNGHTSASDPDTGDRTMKAGDRIIVRDEFVYENLLPGRKYSLTGKVMLRPQKGEKLRELDAAMVDAEGTTVVDYVFTPGEPDGSEFVYFAVDSAGLAGRSIVLFETMEYIDPETGDRTVIALQEDPYDEDETVHFPDGGTTAADSETGSHTAFADGSVTIRDEVFYRNLIPGKMYTVTGTLMDKKTGRPLAAGSDGTTESAGKVTAQKQFVPETADGSVLLTFAFDGTLLAGGSIVAFEKVFSGGKEVFVHEDLEDEDQTVNFPSVRTTATDKKDGDHEISYKGTVTIEDKVEYTNLIPGCRYRVSGILMNRSAGEPAKAGGSEITGETVFTPKQKSGAVTVTFTFDASKLEKGEYVAYETLYEISEKTGDENVVGTHRDLNDASQTVKRPASPEPHGSPATGDDSHTGVWLAVILAAAVGIAGAVIFGKRRHGK